MERDNVLYVCTKLQVPLFELSRIRGFFSTEDLGLIRSVESVKYTCETWRKVSSFVESMRF